MYFFCLYATNNNEPLSGFSSKLQSRPESEPKVLIYLFFPKESIVNETTMLQKKSRAAFITSLGTQTFPAKKEFGYRRGSTVS